MKPTIPIAEIFGPTIQGEGPNAGARCIFVRVQYCTFKCTWCDSKYTWGNTDIESHVETFKDIELAENLINLCKQHHCYHVVLTGGNPCMYDFGTVVSALHSWDIQVDVETQGDLQPNWLRLVDTVVFSPKGPSSGMPDTYENIKNYMGWQWENGDNNVVAIKIPIFNDEDIEFARKYSKFVNEFNKRWENIIPMKMYLSIGNSDVDTTESIRDRVLSDYESLLNKINENPEDFEHVYILPQIHTLVWGNKQGV